MLERSKRARESEGFQSELTKPLGFNADLKGRVIPQTETEAEFQEDCYGNKNGSFRCKQEASVSSEYKHTYTTDSYDDGIMRNPVNVEFPQEPAIFKDQDSIHKAFSPKELDVIYKGWRSGTLKESNVNDLKGKCENIDRITGTQLQDLPSGSNDYDEDALIELIKLYSEDGEREKSRMRELGV